MNDIYNGQKRLDRIIERIKEIDNISEDNRIVLLGFNRNLSVQNISISRRERQLGIILNIIKQKNLELRDASEDELKDVVDWIHSKYNSPETCQTMKLTLRKVYQFIDGLVEKGASPERLKWMKTNIKKCDKKLPEDLISIDEVQKMISLAPSLRDKAFVSVLYESGARIGEMGGLRIKNIEFDNYGAKIQISGKTGPRKIRIVSSAGYLSDWINNHPTSNERSSYVWVSNAGKQLTYQRFSNILKQIAKKAKIDKKVNPHNFRHSRATEMSRVLSTSQLNNYFGWEQGSTMAGKYVHLSGRDNDIPILKMHGIDVEENENEVLKNRKCLRCGNICRITDTHCSKCGIILDKKLANKIIQSEEEKEEIYGFMNSLIKDPEFLALVNKRKQDSGIHLSKN